MKIKGLEVTRIAHDCFKVKGSKTIYFDPFQVKEDDKADVVFITHEHSDHLSPEDIKKVITKNTVVVTIAACLKRLTYLELGDIKTVQPGSRISVDNIGVDAVAAYNVDKFRAPGLVFHPKEDGKVGFIVTLDGVRMYHAGDTDIIEEMKGITCDIALLPVSGTYVMTAKEAAQSTKIIKCGVAVPMHYGAIVGTDADALEFKKAASCDVVIL